MKYRVKCFFWFEPDEEILYDTLKEAKQEKDNQELFWPGQVIVKIEEVEEICPNTQ